MHFYQALVGLATSTLLAFSPTANAFTTSCQYQEYACGYNLISQYGYNITELTSAVNKTTIVPPLYANQLLQVLYRCEDTAGTIAGNSFCIAGCVGMTGNQENDQCAM